MQTKPSHKTLCEGFFIVDWTYKNSISVQCSSERAISVLI
ncbi:hypothetical protein F935_01990 [Acinetobacter calcoaceticus ANC 3811]|uniref:Uncharacterized protein n=1 Tax=Acinetobacter calcoaceticus ANC 3811 TaxID=1217690 RepID=R8Y149_ACICA|nr:hypothetical protein F935_01990 [Acinetobacter calcoaceticus ANC 3811]